MKKQVKLPKIDTYVFATVIITIAVIASLKSCKGDKRFKYKVDETYSLGR